jgi:hypothetical protein
VDAVKKVELRRYNNILHRHYYTQKEMEISRYIYSLASLNEAEKVLMEIDRYESNIHENAIVLARALRGDLSTKNKIVNILAQSNENVFRHISAVALGKVGDSADLLALQKAAENDPWFDENKMAPPGNKYFYPVREAARTAIKMIMQRNIKHKTNDNVK